jgi:hypothetical protein
MNKIESNDPLPGKWFKLKRGRLQGAGTPEFLLFTERMDGIHSLAYILQKWEKV